MNTPGSDPAPTVGDMVRYRGRVYVLVSRSAHGGFNLAVPDTGRKLHVGPSARVVPTTAGK